MKLFNKRKKVMIDVSSKSIFPKMANSNKTVMQNFLSEEEIALRQNLILEHKDLPFVYGYLYSYDGVPFNNYNDLKNYNNSLEEQLTVVFEGNCYSVDGVNFKKFDDAKNYNQFVIDYYCQDFNFELENPEFVDNFKMMR